MVKLIDYFITLNRIFKNNGRLFGPKERDEAAKLFKLGHTDPVETYFFLTKDSIKGIKRSPDHSLDLDENKKPKKSESINKSKSKGIKTNN